MRACLGMNVLGLGRKNGAEIEQLMLDAADHGGKQADAGILADLFLAGDQRQADEGIQLINGAVALDAEGIFGDTLAAGEAGFAGIATLGVDAVEGQTRIFKGFIVHASMVHVTIFT